jgi:hypothetical protein
LKSELSAEEGAQFQANYRMEIPSPDLETEFNEIQQEQKLQTSLEGIFACYLHYLVPSMTTPVSENRDQQSPEKSTDNNSKVGNPSSL